MGSRRWSRQFSLWHPLDAADKTSSDLQEDRRNLRAVQILLGHTKLESTVRYVGIEVEDALSISEQAEL